MIWNKEVTELLHTRLFLRTLLLLIDMRWLCYSSVTSIRFRRRTHHCRWVRTWRFRGSRQAHQVFFSSLALESKRPQSGSARCSACWAPVLLTVSSWSQCRGSCCTKSAMAWTYCQSRNQAQIARNCTPYFVDRTEYYPSWMLWLPLTAFLEGFVSRNQKSCARPVSICPVNWKILCWLAHVYRNPTIAIVSRHWLSVYICSYFYSWTILSWFLSSPRDTTTVFFRSKAPKPGYQICARGTARGRYTVG